MTRGSLSRRLVLGMMAMSMVSALLSSLVLTLIDIAAKKAALRGKVTRYAAVLQRQLEPVVAFEDRLTARELLEGFAVDSEIDGLAVYRSDGVAIDGIGQRPEVLLPREKLRPPPGHHVVARARVTTKEGRDGWVYVSASSMSIQREELLDVAMGLAIALGIGLIGFCLARRVSKNLTERLDHVAAVAQRIGAGDLGPSQIRDGGGDEIAALADAFDKMTVELARLFEERRVLAATERERLEREVAGRTAELAQSREHFRLIVESIAAIPFALDVTHGRFSYLGPQAARFGIAEGDWARDGFLDELLPRASAEATRRAFEESRGSFEVEGPLVTTAGKYILRWIVFADAVDGTRTLRGLILDITEQRMLERELAQAQKLESVGRLSAGIAHEINTPVQFVTDSVSFVKDAMPDLIETVRLYRVAVAEVQTDDAAAARDKDHEVDLDYVLDNARPALDRAMEGLGRVVTIVRAMKDFAHPDGNEMEPTDLNRAIQSTLAVARSEYKHVATVTTDLGDLRPVTCRVGEINQVVLNLLVNAAHAIGDVVKRTGELGAIHIATRQLADAVEVEIRDSGGGIPEAIREKIFDPFFTTKEVGRGTGQGLAIARNVIVEHHHGSLRFETEPGVGTTFFVRIPTNADTGAIAA